MFGFGYSLKPQFYQKIMRVLIHKSLFLVESYYLLDTRLRMIFYNFQVNAFSSFQRTNFQRGLKLKFLSKIGDYSTTQPLRYYQKLIKMFTALTLTLKCKRPVIRSNT